MKTLQKLSELASIFLEEQSVSGDTMVSMNHSIKDVDESKIGAFYIADLLAGFALDVLNSENTAGVSGSSEEFDDLHDVGECNATRVDTDADSLEPVEDRLEKITYIEKTTPCPNCGSTEIYEENDLIRCTGCECQRGCL